MNFCPKGWRYLLLWLLLLAVPACGRRMEYLGSFELASFFETQVKNREKAEIKFQVLDKSGEPVPFALLRFTWRETGARMSFQTDDKGIIAMHFEDDMLDQQVVISVDTKPMGQEVLKTEDYETSTQPMKDARILLKW